MHRFHLPPDQCHDTELTLTGREAHHGSHVLRIRPGETVVVLDGAGHQYTCATIEVARDAIRLGVRNKTFITPLPCQITLVQAIPKGKIFDSIVQKATELGVFRIVPLLAERVVRQFDDRKSAVQLEHWKAIALESIKQCGSAWVPRLEAPISPQAFAAEAGTFDLSFIASLQSDRRHPRALFKTLRERNQPEPKSIGVWVGPEGDFTPEEIAAARSAGAVPITLGPLVLRSDTAAIYCLSILNYEIQSGW